MKYERWSSAAPDWGAAEAAEGIPPLAAAVLRARGIAPGEETAAFLAAGADLLCDPFLLCDMGRAVARITRAVESGERIAVYGDYDVDGITATCLLAGFLRTLGGDVVHYIPDRLEEGYGLNREAVALLREDGVTLVVTVDCGITAVEETEYAKQLGMDVVITDHHTCKDVLPDAVAVVNPHRPDCNYPFPHLAGVGVALKLAQALGADPAAYADLAAVGTVADVMLLTGENRALVSLGLRSIEESPRPGIAALLREGGLTGRPVTSSTVGYGLAPRINAAGRMGCASVAYELLETTDPIRADALAAELCRLNRERQGLEAEMYDDCITRLEADGGARPCLVLDGAGWHQGVAGIVASRLAERQCRPVCMICLSDGRGKASCRSYGGVSLVDALEHCGDLLEGFGGHKMAAGFTILEENIPAFRERMELYISEHSNQEDMVSVLEIDAALSDPRLLTVEQIAGLAVLEPHGAGNPRPVFSLEGCQVLQAENVGGGRHLKLKVACGGTALDGIFFSATAETAGVSAGDLVDVAFTPQVNEFRGRRSPQLQVCDLRPAQERYADLSARLLGGGLSAGEARRLLPSRADFAAVWRSLAQAGRVEEPPASLAARVGTGDFLRTMMCLDILDERGLIDLERRTGVLRVSVRPAEEKVDLEQSPILQRLRTLEAAAR